MILPGTTVTIKNPTSIYWGYVGFICLALFLDGTLRLLGIIPPFLDIDISIVDKIAEKVQTEVMPLIQDASQKAQRYIPGR